MKRIFKKKEIGIILILIVVAVAITAANSVFVRPDNIMDVLTTNQVMGICALGMLLVMLTGGIDVSIGWIVTAVTVVIGKFSTEVGGNLFILMIVACAAGAALGLLNGIIIAKLKLPAIVATLGTMSLLNGLVLLVTNGKYIRNLPDYISGLGKQYIFKVEMEEGGFWGMPVSWLFWIAAIVLTWWILKYTVIGRGVYAVGGNVESAQRLGYKPDRILMFVYAYEGFLAGLAAIVYTGINRTGRPPRLYWI